MRITIKLYALLSAHLPPTAKRNVAQIDVPEDSTVQSVIDHLLLPREHVHLVLLNGVYQTPAMRAATALREDDAIAVWPPVAGG